jgi:hypothetical protein
MQLVTAGTAAGDGTPLPHSYSPASRKLGDARLWATVVTACTTLWFANGAAAELLDSRVAWSPLVQITVIVNLYLFALWLCVAVRRRTLNLPECIVWCWSFVFMGMAPAYQLATGHFPWKGRFSPAEIAYAEVVLLLGAIGALLAMSLKRRSMTRRSARPARTVPEPAGGNGGRAAHSRSQRSLSGLVRPLNLVAVCYILSGTVFILLMGRSLYQERSIFRDRVLDIANLPFGGTLYFVATAGAICVPSALVAAKVAGVPLRILPVIAAVAVGAVATNPLLGSRFLTGSFLVALLAALWAKRQLLRFVPALSVLLLVVLFPTVDVLRGDGTGSREIKLASPEQSLLTPSFDAFEMLVRAVNLSARQMDALPSRVDLAVAPVLKWVPILSRPYIGVASGDAVAKVTDMRYTNVSMPLWGEGHLLGGVAGSVIVLGALGYLVAAFGASRGYEGPLAGAITAPACAALLFIVLRGSLYEVWGYMALVGLIYLVARRCIQRSSVDESGLGQHEFGKLTDRRRVLPPPVPPHTRE